MVLLRQVVLLAENVLVHDKKTVVEGLAMMTWRNLALAAVAANLVGIAMMTWRNLAMAAVAAVT